ncbi:MAG: cytidylate kinase family protein [Rectinemataceae bacterium]
MAIIAIAREFAALGEEVARELVSLSGFRLVDREWLEKRLADFGVSEDKRRKYDERKPGLWASLSQERDDYLHYLKSVIFEEAATGDCVIVGRGATALLRGLPHALTVRVVAPMAARIARVRGQLGCDERHALQFIEQSDRDRSGFQKYFFSQNWKDPAEYSLCISIGDTPSPAEAAAVIDNYRRTIISPESERSGATRAGELVLGQRIVTEIVYGKRLPIHFLEADVRSGRVKLHGVSNTQSAIEAAVAAAKTVPGVGEVESAIQVVQEFTVMP